MRAVLDTNVLLSALLFPGGAPHRVFRAALRGHYQLVVSPFIIQELARVLEEKFAYTAEEAEAVAGFVESSASAIVGTLPTGCTNNGTAFQRHISPSHNTAGGHVMSLPLARRRFTVEDYHRMGEAGILSEDDRVELIEGEIVEMTPVGSRHAGCVNRLVRLFHRTVGDRALVSVQNPVRLGQHSEPQPDVALLKPRADFYAASHPGPGEVLLLVEVVESSAHYDREVKVPLYARAGIQEVWLVDLTKGCVEVHRNPAGASYAEVLRLRRGDRLAPAAFPDAVAAVEDVLGPDL